MKVSCAANIMEKHATSIPCEFVVSGQVTRLQSLHLLVECVNYTKSEQGIVCNRTGNNGMGDCLETKCPEGFWFMQYP
jgi:hypothetical protein